MRDVDSAEHGNGIKAEYIREWNYQWEDFCSWIVEEFRDKYPTS